MAATMAAMRPAATADLKAALVDPMAASNALARATARVTARVTAKAVVAAMAGRRVPVVPCPIAPPIGPQWALS